MYFLAICFCTWLPSHHFMKGASQNPSVRDFLKSLGKEIHNLETKGFMELFSKGLCKAPKEGVSWSPRASKEGALQSHGASISQTTNMSPEAFIPVFLIDYHSWCVIIVLLHVMCIVFFHKTQLHLHATPRASTAILTIMYAFCHELTLLWKVRPLYTSNSAVCRISL